MCIRKSTFPAFQLENENMQLLMREPMWAMGRERRETLIAIALGTLHAPGLGSGWLSGCADKSQSTPCHDSLTWDDDMCLRPSARCLTCCCSLLSPAASLSPDTQVSVHLHLCIQGQLHSAPLGLVLPTVLLLVHIGVLVMETPRSRQLSGTILLPRMCCTVPACSKHFWWLRFHLRGKSVFDQLIVPADCFHSAFVGFTRVLLCWLLLPAAQGQPVWTFSYVKRIVWGLWAPV